MAQRNQSQGLFAVAFHTGIPGLVRTVDDKNKEGRRSFAVVRDEHGTEHTVFRNSLRPFHGPEPAGNKPIAVAHKRRLEGERKMATDVSWRNEIIPATSHLKSVAKNRAAREKENKEYRRAHEAVSRIGPHGPMPTERTTKPQGQRIAEHQANMHKLGGILAARKEARAAGHPGAVQPHPALAHDGKAAAHPHAMMHGPKGGSFYYGAGGKKIYGNK